MRFEMGTQLFAVIGHFHNCRRQRRRVKPVVGHKCPGCGARVERVETLMVPPEVIEGKLATTAMGHYFGKVKESKDDHA